MAGTFGSPFVVLTCGCTPSRNRNATGGGLFACSDDSEVCFWGCFFPACLYGRIRVLTGKTGDWLSASFELLAVTCLGFVSIATNRMSQGGYCDNGDDYEVSASGGLASNPGELLFTIALLTGVSQYSLAIHDSYCS